MAEGALLERTAELGRLTAAIGGTLAGAGSVLVVEGPAGIGKTALAAAAFEAGRSSGLRCARAVGGPLERELAFGAARQLLSPLVTQDDVFTGAAAPAAGLLGVRHDDGQVGAEAALLHALYWFVANVAERTPLLLVADDAHWFDVPSLHFLAYLARRAADLPVTMLIATRPAETEPVAELLGSLLSDPTVELLQPPPLTPAATAALVKESLGADADDAFCAACADAAGGNPFLTLSLVSALADAGVPPTAASAEDVLRIGAAGAGRAIVRRLHTLPSQAREVARAVSILGADAVPWLVADLAGLDAQQVAEAVDILTRAGLLVDERPLRLAHPIVHAAVHDETGPTQRSLAHARAARLLAGTPDGTQRAATHLLATDPVGDPWTVSVLAEAAKADSARGAPASAAGLLERALAEPPQPGDLARVVAALGIAEVRAGLPGAAGHLRSALDLETDRDERLGIASALRLALTSDGRSDEAVRLLIELAAEVGDDADAVMLVETLLVQIRFNSTTAGPLAAPYAERFRKRVATRSDAPPQARAVASMLAIAATEPATVCGELAMDSVRRWRCCNPDVAPVWIAYPSCVLVVSDHPEAQGVLDWALSSARVRGDLVGSAFALENLGWLGLRTGALTAAESDTRTAIEGHQLCGSTSYLAGSVGILCEILAERGDLAAAEDLLGAHGLDGPLTAADQSMIYLGMGRARLRLAQDRIQDALADLRYVGGLCLGLAITTPVWLPWRTELADALARRGETAEAAETATEDLRLAERVGTPRAVGAALRGLAAALPGQAESHLRRATEVLEASPARLEYLRALLALGTVLRRRNARAEARQVLTRALDVAGGCGAKWLADRVRTELVAAGARPRRVRSTGRDALTPTELRVAGLAAAGNTNREIAQAMFLTVKTVETHLRNAYQKLGIAGRAQLAGALVG